MKQLMVQPKIMMVASDGTSDLFGASLASGLQSLNRDVSMFGIGSSHMREAGVRLLYDIRDLDTLGVIQSIKGAHVIRRLIYRISESMERFRPDLLLQVGRPVFNYRLLELAKTKRIPVMYYYTPLSVGDADVKLDRFAKMIDRVAGVTLYETQICQEGGMAADFVGHPLVDLARPDLDRAAARAEFGLTAEKPVVVLWPGKRTVEAKALLPIMLKALGRIRTVLPDVQGAISLADNVEEEIVQRSVAKCGVDVSIIRNSYDLLQLADLAVVTCGSSGLGAALLRTPAIALHRMPSSNYLADKMLSRRQHLAVPNILLNKALIPELVQADCTESALAQEMLRLLQDREARAAMVDSYAELDEQLGEPGSIQRAASMVSETLRRSMSA